MYTHTRKRHEQVWPNSKEVKTEPKEPKELDEPIARRAIRQEVTSKVLDLWASGRNATQIVRAMTKSNGKPYTLSGVDYIIRCARQKGDPRAKKHKMGRPFKNARDAGPV